MTALAAPDLRAVAPGAWARVLTDHYRSGLPGAFGLEISELEPGRATGRAVLRDTMLHHTGGILHAGALVAVADSFAGWGCMASLPDEATGFVTAELKVNLVASAHAPDALACTAVLLHGGRSTQVWDVTVSRESDARLLAHFRCTQQLLTERC